MVRNRNRGSSGVNPIGGEAYWSENGEQNCKETWKIHVFSRTFHLILNPHFFLATRLEKNDSRFMRRKPTVLKSNIKELKQRRKRRQQERQKRNRCRLAKRQLCTYITLFCTFLCRHCTTTTWKCGEREHKTTTFFFFPGTLEENANIWRIERDGISAIKFESSATSLFKWRYRSRRRRCCLSSLFDANQLPPAKEICFSFCRKISYTGLHHEKE